MVKNVRNNTALEWTRKTLNIPGRTVEVFMLGNNMIMTDDIDNIRAIMATQVIHAQLLQELSCY
jgi:hypothetical protein